MSIVRKKIYTNARQAHRAHLIKLKNLSNYSPQLGELFQKISNSEYGLSLMECTETSDRFKMAETKVRLDILRLDGHITFHEDRYYDSAHIELINPDDEV